jgi:hypothetical protein
MLAVMFAVILLLHPENLPVCVWSRTFLVELIVFLVVEKNLEISFAQKFTDVLP